MSSLVQKSDTVVAAATAADGKNLRYVYRHGIVIADDFMKSAIGKGPLPLDGAYIIRLKNPVPCVFITFGHNGIMLPDNGLNVIGDSWNAASKEEMFAVHRLMHALDPVGKYKIRSNWILLDMKETDARIIRVPSDREVSTIKKTPALLKAADCAVYKAIKRVQRRKTTSGVEILDGHEGDSDRDPMDVMMEELSMKEEKYEKSRIARLAPWPDTEVGRAMHKMQLKKEREAASDPQKQLQCPPRKRGRPPGRRIGSTSTSGPSGQEEATTAPAAPQKRPSLDLFADFDDEKPPSHGEATVICPESAIIRQKRTAAARISQPPQFQQPHPAGQQSEPARSSPGTTVQPLVIEKNAIEEFDDDEFAREEADEADDDDYDNDCGEIDYGDD